MFWCSSVQSGIKYCQNMCASSSSILRSNIRLILSNQWIDLSPLIRYIQCDCHLQLFINKNKTKKYYCRNSSTIKQKIIVIDTPNTQKHSRLLSWYRHFNGTKRESFCTLKQWQLLVKTIENQSYQSIINCRWRPCYIKCRA